ATPFIQTDATVQPGSSGGPLLDGSGAVVGIHAQIPLQSGVYQGSSFAVPIQVALKVRDQIVASGRVPHAWLGARVQDLTPALAQARGLDLPDGALIASVVPGSAAAKAGFKVGDVVTHVHGQAMIRSSDLVSRISQALPGDVVLFKVWRDRRMLEFPATLGRLEEGPRTPVAREAEGGAVEAGQPGSRRGRKESRRGGVADPAQR
ncbi:MAG: PDZ domain-containing protein, partial [Rhodoferax sp.]